MNDDVELKLETLLQHLGEEYKPDGAVVPPIYQNSLFVFDDVAGLGAAFSEPPHRAPHLYSRVSNPTVDLAAKKVALLEGAESCVLLGSGMAAISIAIMSCAKAGSHLVVVDTCYGPVKSFLSSVLERYGVTWTYVSGLDAGEVIAALRPETVAVYLESPSTAIFRLQDFEAISRKCRSRGVTTIVDNTYSTPLYQQPISMGIDIVVHSATKYISGHSDVVAGALCTTMERIDRIVANEMAHLGSILHPFPAWLLLRGLRTLPLRIARHQETGNTVARWLENHRRVERTHHVGLESHPQRELYRKQMTGSGGLLSFEPKTQDQAKIHAFVNALNLFAIGVSWGGFESLAVPLTAQPYDYPEPRHVVRLFVGLEDAGDLIADLDQAFKASGL